MILSLYFVILVNPLTNPFSILIPEYGIIIDEVKVGIDQITFGDLKKLICKQNPNIFKAYEAEKMNLWMVKGLSQGNDMWKKLKILTKEKEPETKIIEEIEGEILPPNENVLATILADMLSSQQPFSPYRQSFSHKFYDRKQAMDKIAKVANNNYLKRLSSNHKDQQFILIPGGSGIGKSRAGMESQHLVTHAEESVLANLTVEIELVKAALNDPIYIFIDIINGYNYDQQIDENHAKVRIGVRVAIAAGLIDNTPNFIELYCLDNVIKEILRRRFKEKGRSLETVIIHIDEYQRYIDYVHHYKKISWEDARIFFKNMLQEIGAVMRSQAIRKQEGIEEYFIIPICTGTSAIDVHFLHTEYTKVLVQLKPLDYNSAYMMFLDKYQYSKQTTKSAKKILKQHIEKYYNTSFDESVLDERSKELCELVLSQEHFRIALFDTGFIPKYLDNLLSPQNITPHIDWGNILFHTMSVQSVEINELKPGCWKSIEDICTIISFGITRQTVRRDFLLPSWTSIGDVERAGLIFLIIPTETHSNDEFIIFIPFMLMKLLNKMLLFTAYLLIPDKLLLIPMKDRPWRWQDFESLHGYYQRALIKSLINVKNAQILALEKSISTLQCLSVTKKVDDGDATLLHCQVELRDVGVFIEKEKFLVKTTDIAQFSKLVLCDDNITRSLESAIFHYKYSKNDTMDPSVSGTTLLDWYNITLRSVSSYANNYEIILIFFTVRRFTGNNLHKMPQLLLIDLDCIKDYLSPSFAHCGLVIP
ncbi:6523_t:CDS:2 [Funneliformis mosseae]|uniref:6523_t:CDS:1 n=1 Tax=Funneliformis mosseae TaxID=27381 RepID=A0A9N9HIQ3_FUNMO|nr:6523_t:CDS:2 [Funneliformis mosseae]